MIDKFYQYRPLFDLLGKSEGTDAGRGYNETLGYGAYTNGPVDLEKMTIWSLDVLQGKMLSHPKNKLNSSACGRYQIVRKTRRVLDKDAGTSPSALFDRDLQDTYCAMLLNGRGFTKFLRGHISQNTFIDGMAQEWASLPTRSGKGYYGHALVSLETVYKALGEAKERFSLSLSTPVSSTDEGGIPPAIKAPVDPVTAPAEQDKIPWYATALKILFGGSR